MELTKAGKLPSTSPTDTMPRYYVTLNALAAALHDNHIIKFGSFILKSGLISPFYIDLRQVQSYPEVFHAITDAYAEMLTNTDPALLLADLPEAGTPLASALGYKLRRRLVQPRKFIKEHGTKNSVGGKFQSGDRIILIGDLITKGDSKIEAIEQVQAAGLKVDRLIVQSIDNRAVWGPFELPATQWKRPAQLVTY